jgi:hypothetical protein
MLFLSRKGLVEEMIDFDIELWLYLLHHKQKAAADAMRRAHNRAVINAQTRGFSISPLFPPGGWRHLSFEQNGIDSKAVYVPGEEDRK